MLHLRSGFVAEERESGDANAAYAAPGYLLFHQDRNLLAQRFDLKRFALTGAPTTILTDIQPLAIKRVVFAVSNNGLLVAQTGSVTTSSQLGYTVWEALEVSEVLQALCPRVSLRFLGFFYIAGGTGIIA